MKDRKKQIEMRMRAELRLESLRNEAEKVKGKLREAELQQSQLKQKLRKSQQNVA